jgi:hypothetical protein
VGKTEEEPQSRVSHSRSCRFRPKISNKSCYIDAISQTAGLKSCPDFGVHTLDVRAAAPVTENLRVESSRFFSHIKYVEGQRWGRSCELRLPAPRHTVCHPSQFLQQRFEAAKRTTRAQNAAWCCVRQYFGAVKSFWFW